MKSLIARRPTPATVIACLALFVALGGVSYGVAVGSIDSREIKNETIQTTDIRRGGVHASDIRDDSIRTEDLRNNEIRGVDIRNSTIRGIEVAVNSLAGADIAESTLDTVPRATNADTLDGLDSSAFTRLEDLGRELGRFSVKLAAGQTQAVAAHGQVAVFAQCIDGAGSQDEVRLYAVTSAAEALMDGENAGDDHLGPGATIPANTFLTPTTIPTDAELAEFTRPDTSTAAVDETNGGGFVVGPDGKGLHLQGGSTIVGFNYAGGTCVVAGELSKTG